MAPLECSERTPRQRTASGCSAEGEHLRMGLRHFFVSVRFFCFVLFPTKIQTNSLAVTGRHHTQLWRAVSVQLWINE